MQWTDKFEKINQDGKISIAKYAAITFPKGTFEGLTLNAKNEEDAIIYGEIEEEVTSERGHRISDILKKYDKSGLIKTVNDNSNRRLLPHKKVVVG